MEKVCSKCGIEKELDKFHKFIHSKDGMSWSNWGEWHLDHIKPVSSFDKSGKICIINSLDNLQPLWAADNLKKSNKII